MGIVVKFFGTVFALLLAAYYIPGFSVDSFYIAVVVALVLGVLNVTLKPILLLLTLPLNVITLGLFTFVINSCLILLIASFVQGFQVTGFMPALFGAALISAVSWVLNLLPKK